MLFRLRLGSHLPLHHTKHKTHEKLDTSHNNSLRVTYVMCYSRKHIRENYDVLVHLLWHSLALHVFGRGKEEKMRHDKSEELAQVYRCSSQIQQGY